MTIKIKEILRLLRIVKLYDTNGKSPKNFVQKTFNDEPVKEAVLPNYFEIEKFCNGIKVIRVNSNSLQITELGKKILDSNDNSAVINETTQKILLDCFMNGEIGKMILESLSKFHAEENGRIWYSKRDAYGLFDNPEILPILYEIGLLEKKQTIVELNPSFLSILIERIDRSQTKKEIRITQEQIDANLKIKKIIGNIAEKIVLEYEKNRLKREGFDKESEKVSRISEEYANAGYDICSFNGQSNNLEFDRFIEVKGSTGNDIDFFWSQNEIDEAKKHGERYWIYFVPLINIEKHSGNEPITVCNPIKNILENKAYDKHVESYHVVQKNGFTDNQ